MDSNVIAILSVMATIISALIGALLGVFIPAVLKRHSDKLAARVIPVISIWNNHRDDIDERLKRLSIRWFLNIDTLEEYSSQSYFYLVLRSEKNRAMSECRIYIETSVEDSCCSVSNIKRTYTVGSVGASNISVFPIGFNGEKTKVVCTITYLTEKREYMQYEISFIIDQDREKIINREDRSYVIKISRAGSIMKKKLVRKYDINLTESFTSSEIKKSLGEGGSLNKRGT